MRVLRILIGMLCLAAGVAVGALNPQTIELDLGLAVLRPTLGVALLGTLLAGAVAGGLATMASVVLPMRRRRQAQGPHTRDAN